MWADDKQNGDGAMYYDDNSRYLGMWKDGNKHGQGTFTYSDGSTFVGQFENDQIKEGLFTDTKGNERPYSAN